MTIQDRSLPSRATPGTNAVPARALQAQDFLALYDEYYSRVLSYIHFRCGDAHITEDLTAQTFEKALERLDQYQSERAPFGAWLFAIARNLVNDHFQAIRRPACLPLEAAQDHQDEGPTPEEHLIETELQGHLLQAFQALNARERDLLSLKFGARLTNRRIAALTGLSEANVGVIVYRAVHKLRLGLQDPKTPL